MFQLAAIRNVTDHTAGVLEEQGIPDAPVAGLAAGSLIGVASDGRPVGSLLTLPDLTGAQFDRIVTTQLQDVARQAAAIERAVRPQVTHYVRALNLPSCGRCIILAGKPERSEVAFRRHPQCFPAGVVASGPHVEAAAHRPYDGEVVVLTTASGQHLTVTGNHPVLTRRGWVPANLLNERDEVFRSTQAQGATALVVPHHDQVPSLVEDVWSSLSVGGLIRVPTSPEDFHGDGVHGEVDVVFANGALRDWRLSQFAEPLPERLFTDALMALGEFVQQGSPILLDSAVGPAAARLVSGCGLSLSLGGGHLGGPHDPSVTTAAALDAGFTQDAADWPSRETVFASDGVFADTAEVGAYDPLGVKRRRGPRWDTALAPVSVEGREANAGLGLDLVDRLAGQVEPDRLVDIRRVQWSGHVYSLTSSEGWLAANSLIVSNCDCLSVATDSRNADRLVTDPGEAFNAMTAVERAKAFTKAGAEAIGLGADIGRVVNARSSMETAQVFGRDLKVTGALRARYGQGPRGDTARLMPESIAQIATDRTDHLRLLRLYGYITN